MVEVGTRLTAKERIEKAKLLLREKMYSLNAAPLKDTEVVLIASTPDPPPAASAVLVQFTQNFILPNLYPQNYFYPQIFTLIGDNLYPNSYVYPKLYPAIPPPPFT